MRWQCMLFPRLLSSLHSLSIYHQMFGTIGESSDLLCTLSYYQLRAGTADMQHKSRLLASSLGHYTQVLSTYTQARLAFDSPGTLDKGQ